MSYTTNTHSPELKVQTSLFSMHHTQTYANTVYPSPLSCIEQVSPLQDQPSSLDWTQTLDEVYTPSIAIPNSDSDCSSLDIHTPDTKLSELITSHYPPFGYTSLLHSPDEDNMFKDIPLCDTTDQNCYSSVYFPSCKMNDDLFENPLPDNRSQSLSSLSRQDQMMLLEKIYPEDFQVNVSSLGSVSMMRHRILDTQIQPILTTRSETIQDASLANLSREQLIERVLQLEMEKKSRPSNDESNSCHSFGVDSSPVQTNQEDDSDNANMHSCQWDSCDAKAPTLDKLMTHICDSHIGSGKATYYCEWRNCLRDKKPFMKRHKMHNHMRTHTGERPFICTITGCNKAFSRPDSLSTHIKTHSDIRPYLCSVPGCDKAYFHSRSLRKHLKSTHMKQSKFSVRNGVPSNVTHRYRIATTTKRRQLNADLKSSQLTLSYAPNYATSIFHS